MCEPHSGMSSSEYQESYEDGSIIGSCVLCCEIINGVKYKTDESGYLYCEECNETTCYFCERPFKQSEMIKWQEHNMCVWCSLRLCQLPIEPGPQFKKVLCIDGIEREYITNVKIWR